MTAIQNFCYLALLHASDRLSEQLNAVPDEDRSAIEQALIELRGTPAAELRRRWAKDSEQEVRRQLDHIARRLQMNLEGFPPRLQRWFLEAPGY